MKNNYKMAAKEETEKISSKNEKSACKLCYKDEARYTCPRCNIGYCSSACYKSEAHAGCSEQFYKQCFMEGLKDQATTPEDRQKVMEMLARIEDNASGLDPLDEEEEDEEELADRLQGIDLDKNPDAVWERLNDKEKKEFQQMLNDGRLGNMLQLWDPWWNKKEEVLVEEIGAAQKKLTCPPLVDNISDLNKLLPKNRPADTVVFSVVNLLYSYCYVCRLHNGDHMDTPSQCAEELLEISESLGNKNYHSVPEALHACQQCLCNNVNSLQVSRPFTVALIEDVKHVIEGPSKKRYSSIYTMAALSETIRLLEKAKKELNKEIKEHSKESRIGKELREQRQVQFAGLKKIEFLLSWTNRYGAILEACTAELDIELCTQSSALSRHEADKSSLEEKWGGRPVPPKDKTNSLIEEVTDR